VDFVNFFDVFIKKCEKVLIFQMAYDGLRCLYKQQPINLRRKVRKNRISDTNCIKFVRFFSEGILLSNSDLLFAKILE